MTDLLTRLRSQNVLRCQRDFKHDIGSWSVLEWAGSMAGEAGEAANFAKKITRGDFAADAVLTLKGVTQTAAEHLADEVADTVIYGDLLCARIGTSLAKAIVRKFNATSAEHGSDILLDSCANTAKAKP